MGDELSARESEVLQLVAQGHTNAQVALRLGISPLTVKKHLERMYASAGVRNRAELIARARQGRTDVAPTGPLSPPAGPSTTFVGRGREIAEVAALLGGHRLVTLSGPGGIGKTRLALAVATSMAGTYRDGTLVVELAAVADDRQVAQALASALAIPERPGSRIAALTAVLRPKHALLILDNCEHVVGGAAEAAMAVLRACPELGVLVTSREWLGIPGEQVWTVPPLSVPSLDRSRVVDIAQSEAVRLFVERATAHVPTFDLTAENARVVAGICRALDGMPLAIELAAARTSVLSVEEIAGRLHDPFAELRSEDARVVARHRTLRGVIEWSYQLLTADEAALFDRLSVFAGAFTLDAAENVCPADDRAAEVGDLLARLVDKSFVIADVGRPIARYQLLETLKRFAAERLDARRGTEQIARRHAEHFRDRAERAEPELRGPRQVVWFDDLDADLDDLRAALRWSFAHDPVTAARTAAALWRLFFHRGHVIEGIAWLEQALALDGLPLDVRGKVLNATGNLVPSIGDAARSEALHRENLAIQRQIGGTWGLTSALSNLGDRLRERGALEEARALFLEALALRGSDTWGLALSTSQLGHVAMDSGELAEAERLYAEAIRLWRATGDRLRMAHAMALAARVARQQGRHERAEDLCRRSIAVFLAIGDRLAMARGLVWLSMAVQARGDDARASRLYAAGVVAHRELHADTDTERVDGALRRALQDALDESMTAEFRSLEDGVRYALSSRSSRSAAHA